MHLLEYFRAIYRDWVALMSGLASIVLAFFASYFGYIIMHAKAALWIAAGLCFVITSYRVWAREHSQITKLAIKNEELKLRLTPTLEVLFGTDKPFVDVREFPENNVTVTYHGIQIHNAGETTAHRVRVEVEGFREPKGIFRKLSFWQPGVHQSELSLDPDEKRGILLFKAEPGEDVRVIHPDVPLETGRHDLIIRVLARDLPARVAKAILEVSDLGTAKLSRNLL